MSQWMLNCFAPDKSPDFAQMIIAFCLGILFSPWSFGLVYFLLFLLIYEIYAFYLTSGNPPYWKIETRIGVLVASIFGFIIGRIVTGWHHPLDDNPRISKRKK